MKYIKLFLIIPVIIFFLNKNVYSQKEGDRIIAIVGNDVLLESDLQYQVMSYMRQNSLSKINPALVQQILGQMINEMVIIAKADQDSIEIKPEELNKELEYRVKSLINQYGSEERIEQVYGMKIGQIKITLKDDLVKKMKSDREKRKKFPNGMNASDREIREFYKQYSDSIPPAPDEYELYHIIMTRKVTDDEKNIAHEKALQILDSLKAGVKFEDLAKRYSIDSSSAKLGGDLGWAKRGMFVKNFEDAAYSLQVGQTSDPIETEYGYHIIQMLEKKTEQIHCRHILIGIPKLENNDKVTLDFLVDLKNKINKGEITFEEAVKKYSQDEDTKDKGGFLGLIPVNRLDSLAVEKITNVEFGKVTEPVKVGNNTNYGYEILKCTKKNPSHNLTLDTDYDRIKKYAEYFKENREIDKWIQDLKKTIYVEIKM